MRRLALLLLLAGFGSTAWAATQATVEQVELMLASAKNLPDAKLAAKVSELELTERASSARLGRWQDEFPGKHTREALLGLADASAFLDLPKADIADLAKPDPEARKQIFLRAIDYANTTIHKLPNFTARRSTTHFDDVSPMQKLFNEDIADQANGHESSLLPPSTWAANGSQPLRVREKSTIPVTYRDGLEVADAQAGNDKKTASRGIGLTTWGEFGPILSVIFGDVIHGKLYWGHWEQGAAGPIAIFRYAVPQEMSHYTVLYRAGDKPQTPAYHGEIAVDPANGTILRVTLISELGAPEALESSILVEYGSVTIGDANYTCPVRGVALSKVPGSTVELAKQNEINAATTRVTIPRQTLVNDVSFTEYHVFRADVRVLP